ncbi:creatininase family protein [Natrarchaeobius halalkaliphilus]|uniref:Creatininase family protein n=1 Tax=Natrarchaeobius halalkaliphilus TaxID=1679091 RepID=A0A3N6LJ12_9EURY|nr:creatininase family protein [Natrarchaeobius halalkaliphilus]RQG87811.1 creatininase family protein [Natrarchaeobius halalkaliphilus]
MFEASAGSRTAWGGCTYDEIDAIANEDGSILVLPVGSVEQHGNHLPVGTDTILANEIAALGAERVADEIPIVLLPPFWSGYSPHHLTFGGTVSLEFDQMLETLEEIAETALENGFDAFLFVNGHGGNQPVIDSAVSTVGSQQPNVETLGITYFQLAKSFIDEIRESDPGGMAHGGEFETSLMLYLREELVHRDELEGTYLDEPYDLGTRDLLSGGPLSVYREFDAYSETGAIGDPKLASAEKGERIYHRLGDELEQLLSDIHQQCVTE